MKTDNQNNGSKKSNTTKWVLLGLGILGAGAVSVFSYQHWKKNQTSTAGSKTVPSTNSTQPVKKGLIDSVKTFFQSIRSKKTNAPKDSINSSASKTKGGASTKLDAKKISGDFHAAINGRDYKKVNDLFKILKTPADYTSVNKVFGLRGLKPSIATTLLATFNTAEQKKSLIAAFSAIGLKYNGKKWALAGISDNPLLITTQPTQVWKDSRTHVSVPENMVLGNEVTQRGGFTLFENESQKFLVKTQFVKHYTNNNS